MGRILYGTRRALSAGSRGPRPWPHQQVLAALAAGALAFGLAAAAPARAEGTLTVCLEEDTAPYSFKHGKEVGGFDLAVADAVARRLGRSLAVLWYETEHDKDVNPVLEENALLSDGLCQLVAGFPLFADALAKPDAATSRLPDHEGAKPDDRRRWVKLGVPMPSRPYHFAPLTVVPGPKLADRKITGLADLQGLKLGAEDGTLADTILLAYGGTRLANAITHVVPGHGLLERLEEGDYDATLVELHRFDAYRAKHPETKLAASGFYHPIGFNMGFVGLAKDAALIEQVDVAIGELLAKGELPPLAQTAGMTYLPPRQPDVLDRISLVDLYRN